VRLNRKRFWGQEYDKDKIAAFQTLYTCLETVAVLMSPIAPFFADKLFIDLNKVSKRNTEESVHLTFFPKFNEQLVDKSLEERMDLAQNLSSMVLGLRRKCNIKVRQPLSKIMIPILDETFEAKIEAVKNIILTEINVKSIEFLKDASGLFDKKIKPNFKLLGKKYGKYMKDISAQLAAFTQAEIITLENTGTYSFEAQGTPINLTLEEVDISTDDIPGLLAVNSGKLTVALDTELTDALKEEGYARELVNKIQNLRKDSGLEVTDKISVQIADSVILQKPVENFKNYICSQTLTEKIEFSTTLKENENGVKPIEIDDENTVLIKISKI
jgi:isoleucyl-tRNA synthetase